MCRCKICEQAAANASRQVRRHRDVALNIFRGARRRAKERGIPFSISAEDVVVPDKCPVLGLTLEISGGNHASELSPTLDRIENVLGYVKGNVLVISWRANRLKSNATIEELQLIAAFYSALAA